MSDFAQTVKQQADIVKVIGGYIRLRQAGAQRFSGLCPFHKEKSPSFSVNAARQFFYCFGCHESGDVFHFVGKIENLSFPEAVRSVAQKCGIPLPKREYNSPEEAAEAGQRRKLLDLHEAATLWFQEQLRSPDGAFAREYLAGRGVTPEAVKLFRLGYAPDNFNALRDRLSSTADPETLRASGLFSWKQQDDEVTSPQPARLYDRFRKRVMFPICNESGKVIAFTARTLDTGDKAGPKYLNSPETPLYSKGQVLFNLDKANSPIRAMEFALLVEGQMDCISVFMRGIQNVIATSGTAFTEQQVGLLRRQTTNVVVNFDPDAAGANAAEKSITLLTEEGFTIKVVTLDGGLDPDRFIRERGVEAYAAAIRQMEFALLVEGQMDCISVFMRGIQSVIATSGTAFTEQQVALLRRHTTNVVVNFDPDAAGANAAEKSIGLLTEEGFQIKVVTLDGGLDPDRFIRERGVEAYVAAIRGARRQSDYLIERARQQFPGAGADAKIKAMNYLLPHIRRIPEKLERDQFAHDAAQKLGIDSAVLREELRQAAITRRDRIEVRSSSLSEVERVLLRALAITDPHFAASRQVADEALQAQPTWFEHLGTYPAMQALASRQATDPMEAVEDPEQRALLAEALLQETEPPSKEYLVETLAWLEAEAIEKQLKQVRVEMADAEVQGGWEDALKLHQKRSSLERRLCELKKSGSHGEGS